MIKKNCTMQSQSAENPIFVNQIKKESWLTELPPLNIYMYIPICFVFFFLILCWIKWIYKLKINANLYIWLNISNKNIYNNLSSVFKPYIVIVCYNRLTLYML